MARSNGFFSILVLIVVSCGAVAAQSGSKFDPNGGTVTISIDSKVPKALESFIGFALVTENFRRNGTSYPVKPSGVLYETGDHTLALSNIVFNGQDLSFSTIVVRGVSYKFSGTAVKPAEKDSNGNDIVMTGHLTKFLRGKQIAEADAKFTFEEGD